MHMENTITIERPIEEVFEYVSTPENDPRWVSVSIRNQRTSPGPMRVGMTTEEDVKIFGRTSRDTWEVTEYEPPTVIAYRATSASASLVPLSCLASSAVCVAQWLVLFVSDVSPSRVVPDSRTLWNMRCAVFTTRR